MRVVEPKAILLPNYEIGGESKRIELIARTCYKSEDKICEGSDVVMLKNLCTRKHYAMLEHASAIFEVNQILYISIRNYIESIRRSTGYSSYLRLTWRERCIVSGNLRAWLEFLKYVNILKYKFDSSIINSLHEIPVVFDVIADIFKSEDLEDFESKRLSVKDLNSYEEKYHYDRSVKFICDRGVSHELVRHRPASFAQESTRYCNYAKDKYDNQITVIRPFFFEEGSEKYRDWLSAMETSERLYLSLLDRGASPQEARTVLCNSLKTEVIVTTNMLEWKHIFDLRALGLTGAPHPQMLEVMEPLYKEFDFEQEEYV